MGFLSDDEKEYSEFAGHKFRLNLAFDVVLELQNLMKESAITEYDKLELALSMLVVNRRRLKKLNVSQKVELLQKIYMEHIYTDRRRSGAKGPQLVDFEQDGAYIFASFYLDYGIDLVKEQGRLSFRKFMALFQGLSEKTKIREVMSIRGQEIPSPNQYNQKEIQNLMELKAFYALNDTEEGYRENLNSLFNSLERMAEK